MTSTPAPTPYQHVAVAFQGGGARGADHIGGDKALSEAGYRPNLVSGISIGAFTAAIIAGNEPEARVRQLEDFWAAISWPDIWAPFQAQLDMIPGLDKLQGTLGFLQSAALGQPHFFVPRIPTFELRPPLPPVLKNTSYYDTSPMVATLQKYADFDRINAGKTRLVLGAVRVRDGRQAWFDSQNEHGYTIRPEHVIASGALPPGFPGMPIEGELYWDGGVVSNTPLEAIYALSPQANSLVFMIDLFSVEGDEPRNMDEVTLRQTEILYASRTAHHIKQINRQINQGHRLSRAGLPADEQDDQADAELLGGGQAGDAFKYDLPPLNLSCDNLFDIVHATLSPPADQKSVSAGSDFSRTSISARSKAGYTDMSDAIKQLDAHLTVTRAEDLLGGAADGVPTRSKVFKIGRP